jgi:prolyl-tRNA synthetase
MKDFQAALAARKCILAPWAPDSAVEELVKKATKIEADEGTGEGGDGGAKTLCVPFEQPEMPVGQACLFARALLGEERPATEFALWGRSY